MMIAGDAARSYALTYRQMFGAPPPSSLLRGSSAADILSPARGFMGGFDMTMQIQVGCPGGCLFCYVPNGSSLAPANVRGLGGRHWGFVVRDKADAVGKLRRHAERGDLADKTVYWSGVTDPYAATPTTTRGIWEYLSTAPEELRPRRVVVQTRFRTDRDASLMKDYCRGTAPSDSGPPLVISFSIGTDRDDLIRSWERATPLFRDRMKAVENLRLQDIYVVATLSPFAAWNDLTGTLKALEQLGVAYVTVLFFKEKTRSANTPKRFLKYLREQFPELLDQHWQQDRLSEIEAVFGESRVLTGQKGFASLAKPQDVLPTGPTGVEDSQ